MKLEMLERLAETQGKVGGRTLSHDKDVYLSVVEQKQNDPYHKRKRVRFAVYREAGQCKFKNACFWLPVYVADEHRVYLIYSDKKKGYKQQPTKKGIGVIEFTSDELAKAIEEASKNGPVVRDWRMDRECGRPYVDLY